jgi:uncharacterized protein YxeA
MKINKKYILIAVVIIIAIVMISVYNKNNDNTTTNKENILQNKELRDNKSADEINRLWKEDILYLGKKLNSKHKNMYHSISKKEYESEVQLIIDDLPNLTDMGKIIKIKELVAKIGDGHTAVIENMEVKSFPVKLMIFEDGLYVINTIDEYKEILGTKLIKIGNEPIDGVIKRMGKMISRDNEVQLLMGTLNYIVNANFLLEYGFIDDINNGDFVFETLDGEEISKKLVSIRNIRNRKWLSIASKYSGLINMSYVKNGNQPYWFEYLPEHNLVYFQYNACINNKENPINDFTNKLLKFVEENNVVKFIFDMRFNGGGDYRVIEPVINAITKNKKINKENNLFVVIGKHTYSSAILNSLALKQKTNAILIGEPTGGKPNHYGEIKTFDLPNTGLTIQYSTKYFKHSNNEEDSIYPDIRIKYDFKDFIKGIDPAMEAILSK